MVGKSPAISLRGILSRHIPQNLTDTEKGDIIKKIFPSVPFPQPRADDGVLADGYGLGRILRRLQPGGCALGYNCGCSRFGVYGICIFHRSHSAGFGFFNGGNFYFPANRNFEHWHKYQVFFLPFLRRYMRWPNDRYELGGRILFDIRP